MRVDLPSYRWFNEVPKEMLTRRQLAERGLKPGGPVRAQVVWRRGKRVAHLFELAEARPKRPLTPAQQERVAQNQRKRIEERESRERAIQEARERRQEEREEYRAAMIAADRAAAIRQAQELLALGERAIILDTETTDLDGYMVQLGVLSLDGTVLVNTMLDPQKPISAGAQSRHGISAEMLVGAPRFAAIWPQLNNVLRDRIVIAFNASFDSGILFNELGRLFPSRETRLEARRQFPWLFSTDWRCAMELYAQFLGCWSEYHGSYTWFPLPGASHSAIGDCEAVLALLGDLARAAEASHSKQLHRVEQLAGQSGDVCPFCDQWGHCPYCREYPFEKRAQGDCVQCAGLNRCPHCNGTRILLPSR